MKGMTKIVSPEEANTDVLICLRELFSGKNNKQSKRQGLQSYLQWHLHYILEYEILTLVCVALFFSGQPIHPGYHKRFETVTVFGITGMLQL